jgi:GT2 family glycosyltransferase
VVLPSLREQTYGDFRVIVVDNGSTDGTVEHVRAAHPEVRLLELGTNRGFAAAVNRGIAAGGAEHVAVVNNDLELDPHWLEWMVAALRDHPGAGSATGKMLFYDRRDVIDGAGDFTSWYAISAPRGRGEVDQGQYDTPEPVFSACGGAAVYRRAAIDAVGLFDEDFFAYAEDVDWGFRAQLAGWTCRYVPSAVVFHMGGATSGRVPNLSRYLFFRNTLWMVAKDWPAAALARNAPRLLLFLLKSATASIRGRWFRAMLRGAAHAAAGLPRTLRKRRSVQRSRRVDMAYLNGVVRPDYPLESRILAFIDGAILNRD